MPDLEPVREKPRPGARAVLASGFNIVRDFSLFARILWPAPGRSRVLTIFLVSFCVQIPIWPARSA